MPAIEQPTTTLQTASSRLAAAPRLPAWLGAWVLPTLAVTIALLVWQNDVLWLPPWQDQAVGWWTEADYLASSKFAYLELLYEENHFMDTEPGPRSYMISVLPTLLALGMLAISHVPTLIVTLRVTTFMLGALLVVGTGHVISASGTPRWLAVLFCAALATTPLFVVQLDVMGMDVPLAVVMFANAALLWRRRWQAASLMSLAAFALKATGQLMTFAGITYLALRLICGWQQANGSQRRAELWGVAAHVVVLFIQWAIVSWGDTSVVYLTSGDWPENLQTANSLRINTPDIAVLLAAGLLLMALHVESLWRARWRSGCSAWSSMVGAARHIVLEEPRLLLSWILLAGLIAASLQFIFTARYVFCVMPFLYIVLGRPWLGATTLAHRVTAAAVVLLILANLVNQEGRFCADLLTARGADVFDGLPGLTPRSCMYSERSREYLRDHLSNVAAFEMLDRKYADHPIFVASPNVFLLSRPRLGHVRHNLEVIDASLWTKALAGFREVMLRPEPAGGRRDPIMVWFGHAKVTLPPPELGDEILYDDSDKNPDAPMVIYMKHLPADVPRRPAALDEWYIAHTWSPEFAVFRARERQAYLADTGRLGRALWEIDQAVALLPENEELQATRAQLKQRLAGLAAEASEK